MLQSRKDALTVGILSRLKQKGPPRNEIQDQDLMAPTQDPAAPAPPEEENMNSITTVPPGSLQKPPRKRNQPAGGLV